LWGGVLGSLIATAIGILWFDLAPIYLLLFSFAQLIGFGSAQAATMAAEAHHRADVGLWINISGAVIRMSALGLFLMFGNRTLEQWSIVLFAAMVVWGAWSLLRVALSFGGVHARRPPSRHELRLGAGFVFVQTSSSGQTDVDKIVLNAYDLRADAGIYSPGYRIAEMATVPLVALVRATYAEFFRRGSTAVSEALSFARRLTLIAVGYGVVAGAALYVLAPLVEIIASEAVVEPVRWLAFIPLVKGLQYFPGNVLTGADHHQVRSWIIFVTFVVNVVGNLLFIPEHGWKAAALTTLGAESLFAVLLWTAVAVISRRERMERSGA
jgi:O-antigen/teichoic acid export membrane protein